MSIYITSTSSTAADRHAAIRAINQKKAFWQHATAYGVLTSAFWTSWVIAGFHQQWTAPWPLLPTVLWGLVIVAHAYRLGGRSAISHATIAHEVYDLAHPHNQGFTERSMHRQIRYADSLAALPIRPFHFREVIDAREATNVRTNHSDVQREPAEASTSP